MIKQEEILLLHSLQTRFVINFLFPKASGIICSIDPFFSSLQIIHFNLLTSKIIQYSTLNPNLRNWLKIQHEKWKGYFATKNDNRK